MLQRMKDSIIQFGDPKCFVCGSVRNLERHHVMSGTANRKLSEQYGLVVWLCREHHTGAIGVHNDYFLNKRVKRAAQKAFEDKYGHETWMAVFHKNYL